jgi:transposase
LANAQHIKNVPGRKTDQKDAEWIAQLLQYGLLRASYIPCEIISDLRDLTRMRASLSQEASRISSRIQKVRKPAAVCRQFVPNEVKFVDLVNGANVGMV